MVISYFAQTRADGADFIRAVDRAFQYTTRVRFPGTQRSDGNSVKSEAHSTGNAIIAAEISNVTNPSCPATAGHSFHPLPAKSPPAQAYSQMPAPVTAPAPPQYFPVPEGSAMAHALTALRAAYVYSPNIPPRPPPPTPFIMHQTPAPPMVYQQSPPHHYMASTPTAHPMSYHASHYAPSRSFDARQAPVSVAYPSRGTPVMANQHNFEMQNSTTSAYTVFSSNAPQIPTLSYPEREQYLQVRNMPTYQQPYGGFAHSRGSNIASRGRGRAQQQARANEHSFGRGRGLGRLRHEAGGGRGHGGHHGIGNGGHHGIGNGGGRVQNVPRHYTARGGMARDGADDNRDVPAAESANHSISRAPTTY